MSETIKWNELPDKAKVELIIAKVMGWVFFPTWDLAHTAKWALAHEGLITYPYAFWNDQFHYWCIFYRDMEDARPFDPLHSMDAAWQVVERITQPPQSREEAEQAANIRFSFWFDHANLWAMSAQDAAEAICVAALRAKGFEIVF